MGEIQPQKNNCVEITMSKDTPWARRVEYVRFLTSEKFQTLIYHESIYYRS